MYMRIRVRLMVMSVSGFKLWSRKASQEGLGWGWTRTGHMGSVVRSDSHVLA